MSVQIVTYQDDHLGIRIPFVEQPLDECDPIRPRPLLFGLSVAPAGQRLCGQKDAACAIANIFVVLVTNARFLRRVAFSRLGEELDGFSSIQTTGRRSSYGRLYTSRTSSIAATNAALCSEGMHQHFFR